MLSPPEAAVRHGAPGAVRYCASCERLQPPGPHVCPHCPVCGFDSADGALYCDFCKEPFVKKSRPAAAPGLVAQAAAPSPRPWRAAAAALTVAALALGWHPRAPAQPAFFDSSRDPVLDISAALTQARSSGKLVLIEVGGDWCPWSVSLARLLAADPRLTKLRDERYVTVKVYAGPVVYNLEGLDPQELQALKAAAPPSMLPSEALSRYPEIHAFPYLLVLDCEGNLLQGKDVEEYERGDTYDAARLAGFLDSVSPMRQLKI